MRPKYFTEVDGLFRNEAEFLKRRTQLSPAQLIRAYNYGALAPNEVYFVVGENGTLYDTKTKQKVDPNNVLSETSAPDGWCFEGFSIEALPESEIEKIVNGKNNK